MEGDSTGSPTLSRPHHREVAVGLVREAKISSPVNEVADGLLDTRPPSRANAKLRVLTPTAHDAPPFAIPSRYMSQPQEPANTYEDLNLPRAIAPNVTRKRVPHSLRASQSMPGLAHQLSHKISSTFGNPTIVHRPNLRSRPSLHSIHELPPSIATPFGQASDKQATDSPSSIFFSGSSSPLDLSTAKTSLDSNPSLKSAKSRTRSEKVLAGAALPAVHEGLLQDKPLTPIQEQEILFIKPTVRTVETTANAKIFFETHFSPILSGQATPRNLRLQELERRLDSETLSLEQKMLQRQTWLRRESDHLRQTRALHSQEGNSRRGIAVAGYDVVRVLGRGSFGVVRLVREKNEEVPELVEAAREATTLRNAIKATLDAPMFGQHRRSIKVRREVYAMKVIRKSEMLRNSQEGHLRAERDFLVASEKSRWVVPLISSFQDNTNLYLVMEFMIGGDFLGLLIRKGQLRESRTQWYIAEMILCIEEAHKLRWIHRDIKPDNFLISASGHLKISDFGLAFGGHWSHDQSYYNNHRYSLLDKLGIKVEGDATDREETAKAVPNRRLTGILTRGKGRVTKSRHEKPSLEDQSSDEGLLQWRDQNSKRRLARSVVGTSQYMAPEIIRGELYDGRCDWWSVGIIMFEVRSRSLLV